MTSTNEILFKKLNYRSGPLFIFQPEYCPLYILSSFSPAPETKLPCTFALALAFCITESDVSHFASGYSCTEEDPVVWIIYPKMSSPQRHASLGRDHGMEAMGLLEMEGVAAISFHENWSAQRFRRTNRIKKLQRSFSALSPSGRKRQKKASGN